MAKKEGWIGLIELAGLLDAKKDTLIKMIQRGKYTLIKLVPCSKGGSDGKQYMVHISDPEIPAPVREKWESLRDSQVKNSDDSTEASDCPAPEGSPEVELPEAGSQGIADNDGRFDFLRALSELKMKKPTTEILCFNCGKPVADGTICEACESNKKAGYRAWLKAHATGIMMKYCGVSKLHCTASLENDYPSELVLEDKWNSLTYSFLLTGKRGTGKTHLAVAMMRNEIENLPVYNGSQVPFQALPLFVLVSELACEFRESRDYCRAGAFEYSTKKLIDKYSQVRLLVLDDLFANSHSGWSEDLFILMDKRYRNKKRTIITTNLTLDEISERIDDRIASRIAGMCKGVSVSGQDRRLNSELNRKGPDDIGGIEGWQCQM